jgi:hypothetical protein
MAATLPALGIIGIVVLGYRIYRRQARKSALLKRLAVYSMTI